MSLEELQEQIDTAQMELHEKIRAINKRRVERKVALYKERDDIISSKAPKNFWGLVIRAHKEIASELLGSYDDQLLDKLTSLKVIYNPEGGRRVQLTFEPNDFFSEKELWIESDGDGGLKSSGVSWKEGYGPSSDDEEPSGDAKQGASKLAGKKRSAETRGPSFLEVFEELIEPEEPDDEEDDEENEEFEDLMQDYEEEVEEREEVIEALADEVYANPIQTLMSSDE